MSNSLDMSLDDLIKRNKQSNPRSTGGGPGPTRRFTNRSANRTTPYLFSAPKAPEDTWRHDMYSDQAQEVAGGYRGGGGAAAAIQTGTKIFITNLDYGVSNEDIKELFSEVGDMKRFSIHYDRSGRSKGTAEVIFSRKPDAIAAVKRYDGVQLDGKPMKIELVRTNIIAAPPAVPISNRVFGNSNGIPRRFGWRAISTPLMLDWASRQEVDLIEVVVVVAAAEGGVEEEVVEEAEPVPVRSPCQQGISMQI